MYTKTIISMWIIIRKNINRLLDILALAFRHNTKKCPNVSYEKCVLDSKI